MNTLSEILTVINSLLAVAATLPTVGPPAAIADALVQIAQKTLAAHQALLNTPLDLTKLHDITPIP